MRAPTDRSVSATRAEIQPDLWLDSRRAVWLARERLLVIADLHWGYAASHRARGNLVPWWGDDEIEQTLLALVADYDPAEMIWVGDVVHAAEGSARAEAFLRNSSRPVTVLAGNHDRRWRTAVAATAQRGRYFLHHGDVPRTVPGGSLEILGHHHPAVNWSDGAGASVRIPVLVASPRRLVLPAFSPWAAGAECRHLVERDSVLWAVTTRRIFALPAAATITG